MAIHLLLGDIGPWVVPPGGAVPLRFGEGEIDYNNAPFAAGGPRLPWKRRDTRAANGPRLPWSTLGYTAGWGPRLPWSGLDGQAGWGPLFPWEEIGVGARGGVQAPWNAATPAGGAPCQLPWGPADQATLLMGLPWGPAEPHHALLGLPFGPAEPHYAIAQAPWGQAALGLEPVRVPWGAASLLVAPNQPLPGTLEYGTRPPDRYPTHLHFCVLEWDTHLVLGSEACITRARIADGTAITSRRTYMQTHSLTAYRLPDLTPLPITSFGLSASADAVGWTFTGNGTSDLLTLLAPTAGVPAKLQLNLDGLTWEFVVEGLRRNRTFGKTAATVTGRSTSALLAEPYAATRAYLNAVPMTAQQLVEDVLLYTGVTLTWQITDWLVPAGAWSHTGTPMSAIRRVAEAVGALVQSPRTGDVVLIKPRYPVLPWDWAAATPDVTLALDPVASEGYERRDRPAFEGVYISGQAQGVLALVKRTGTAPASNLLLPLVTDPLMTHLDAARQRGEALLGPTGPMADMTLNLPVLTGSGEPGVIDPNKLVLVNDPAGAWRGLVRAVNVSGDHVSVRQTLNLERHL